MIQQISNNGHLLFLVSRLLLSLVRGDYNGVESKGTDRTRRSHNADEPNRPGYGAAKDQILMSVVRIVQDWRKVSAYVGATGNQVRSYGASGGRIGSGLLPSIARPV
jgi:hypothetical protein